MANGKVYKTKLLILLEILQLETNEEHYLSTNELLEKLMEKGVECDRRTLYKDIELLNSLGYEIICDKSKGMQNRYFIVERTFDCSELRILLDAVQAASFITPKKTKELVYKIASLGGSYSADILKKNIVYFNTTKSSNEQILYSVNSINTAIAEQKKISFKYFDYDSRHERQYRKNGKRYYFNPHSTIFDDGYYYLVGYYGKHGNLVNFRIDRMDCVRVEENQPKEDYIGDSIDLRGYKKTLFGMFQGDSQKVTFEANKKILNVIFDVFGENITLYECHDNLVTFEANVQVSPTFFGWCCLFKNDLRVIGPESTVQDLKNHIFELAKSYDMYQ